MKLRYALLCFLTACTTAPVTPPTPAPSVPAVEPVKEAPKKYQADWDHVHPEWTPILVEALKEHGESLLSGYREGECGDRIAFYVMFLSSLARYESNFKPETTYTENFYDNQGELIISRGPLQLSKESANGYGCKITDEKQLHDVKTNLSCGVRILNKWVDNDGVIHGKSASGKWLGGSRYWSPLRSAEKTATIMKKARSTCP